MVKGFLFSAARAGIKYEDRLDLGLIYSKVPATAAGVFTTNRVKAAPVIITQPRVAGGRLQAIIVNSGNANACNGPKGLKDAERMADLAAGRLGLEPGLVGVCSTGVIGRRLSIERIEAALPALVAGLGPDRLDDLAQAIMTTDTRPKKVELSLDLDGTRATLAGVAKGAGMIHPDLATLIVFLVTDAQVAAGALAESLTQALPRSFHGLTIDGDTSTNDSVILLANSASGGPLIEGQDSPGGPAFYAAVKQACRELALMIVADAEGGTKVVMIKVKGAGSEREGEMVARAIALSPLCKTAFFGADPNWGRIICAAGYSGARFDPERVDIFFGQAQVCADGQATGPEALAQAEEVMKDDEFSLIVDLKAGSAEQEIVTSDLSLDYVRINAEYTT